MTSRRACFALVALVLSLAAASPVLGLANRVFVSQRSGNNANACDNIATPCLSFAGAVLQLNPGGELIVLDSGGYGPVTIMQSVIIEAPPGVLAFIHPPTSVDAIKVNAPGATVVLRGLTIDGAGQPAGSGINVVSVATLHVENCVITGFAASGVQDGDGIFFGSAGELFVKDTIARGNGNVGIYVAPPSGTAKASVDHCRLEKNAWGLYTRGTVQVSIRDSVASGNSSTGLVAESGEVNAEGCLVANNAQGLQTFTIGTLRASNCTITDNGIGVGASGGSLLSRSNNTLEGNASPGTFTGFYSAH